MNYRPARRMHQTPNMNKFPRAIVVNKKSNGDKRRISWTMSDQAQPHHRNVSQQLRDIANPHDHDVLSGRGNFVNYHAGNEHFRALVRKHKVAYVACPKPQKAKFSRLIVDEVRSRDPPGRFLKQDNKTKLWYDIGDKKALDKTRQALREGAPDLLKELHPSDDEQQHEAAVVQPRGGNANDIFSSLTHAGAAQAQPSVVTSGTGLIQQDLRHTGQALNINQTSANVAMAAENLETLQKQLTSAYSTEQFEPAPITAPLGVQIREAQAQLQALQTQLLQQQTQLQQQAIQSTLQQTQTQQPQPRSQPAQQQQAAAKSTNAQMAPPRIQRGRFERESSLKFHELFKGDNKGEVQQKDEKEGGAVEDVSAMSGMSFSVGNMTVSDEESNLSAVFEDSVRISEKGKRRGVGHSGALPNRTIRVPAEGKIEASSSSGGVKQPSDTQQHGYGQQSTTNMEAFDMSAMTLGSSTMQMSFNGGFGESQDLGKLTRKKEDW